MALLNTDHLPRSVKRSLAWGLDARWLELVQMKSAGYAADNTKGQREQLIRDARQAHALGMLSHLPGWAKW